MTIRRASRSLVLICVFIIILCLHAAQAMALDVIKRTEPDGLLVVQAEQHALPIVMVTLLIKASPVDEQPGKAGVAHLTSKMLTEGTVGESASELNEDIEFLGASLEASTNYDFTSVSLSVLKKDIDKGFAIFSDVVLHPAFKENDLGRKKSLIVGILKQKEEEPSFAARQAFIKEVFGNHAYGRLVEGNAATVRGLQRDDVVHFYRAHYLPENAILSVVGDLTPAELDALLKKYFSSWQGTPSPRVSSPHGEGDIIAVHGEHTGKSATMRRVLIDRDISQANIILGHKGISRNNPDYYAVTVMNYILGGGGFASRLVKTVREEMGLTYNINSSFVGNKEPGQFEVDVQTKNASAGTVVEETLKQIKKIRTEPVSDQELADAKAYLTGSFPLRLETSRRLADFLAAVQFYNLGDDYIKRYPEYIKNVTKEDVQRVAKKYLNVENPVIVIVGDQKKIKLPDF